MRAFCNFEVLKSIHALVAATQSLRLSPRQGITLMLTCCVAITLAVGAVGDGGNPGDPEDPPIEEEEEHTPPRIDNFQAFFDGIDQYSIFGEVVECDDVEDLEVILGGVFQGYSTTTRFDGSFHILIIHEEAPGQLVTGKVTCGQGLTSETNWLDLY